MTVDQAGRTLAQREAARTELATAAAARMGLSLVCATLTASLEDEGHLTCPGEQPGGTGCLCLCHDAALG